MDLEVLEHLRTKTSENHSNQNFPFEALKLISNVKLKIDYFYNKTQCIYLTDLE